jgi:Kae1-associated kinase Bud32
LEALKESRLIRKGAEADIYFGKWFGREAVAKLRIEKKYRVPQLDMELRRLRTVREAQLIHEAKKAGVHTPTLLFIDEEKTMIIMEFVKGEKIKDSLERLSKEIRNKIFRKIGEDVARLHKTGTIHGDLTTSNIIVTEGGDVVFIDFGLGSRSKKTEDKGVDIHLLRRALQSTHHKLMKECYDHFLEGYRTETGEEASQEIMKRALDIEKRGRYAIR